MRKNFKWLGVVLAILCVSSCNKEKEEPVSTEETSLQVGDFNFMEQQTTAPVHTVNTTSSFVYVTDASGNAIAISGTEDIFNEPVTDDSGGQNPFDTTTPFIDVPLNEDSVSNFMDLSTNYSIQIGTHAYVSIPQNLLENCVPLDTFLDNQRVAYNLIAEENRASLEVQKEVYSKGTCVHLDDQKLYIDAFGFGYWVKNFEGTLHAAKEPTMQTFNLGKIEGDFCTLTKNYQRLGTKISENETDYYYRAVYSIKDVESNDKLDARAIIIYDKTTSSTITCVVYINKNYYTDGLIDTDFLASSCRFSTIRPDNCVTFN